MPAFALTAAEIAAAEAAAIATAEAAAVHAAQVAAAQAAQAAAAQAATQAAAQAATQAAAQQATTSGIQTLAQEVTGTPSAGIEALNMAQAPVTGQVPTGIETLNLGQAPVTGPAPGGMSQAQYDFLHNSTASTDPAAVGEIIKSFPPVAPPPPPAPTLYGSAQPPAPPSMGPNTFPDIVPQAPAAPDRMLNYGMETQGINAPLNSAQPSQYSLGNQVGNYNLTTSATPPTPEPNFLQSTFKEFKDMSLPNKLLTGMIGATGYEMLNRPKPKEKEKYKSTFDSSQYTGYQPVQPEPYKPQYAAGGLADLGGYSDGGRMLKGPGDGMSDDIPATIAGKQPARLANEEFVIPADVVSHLGNGSSEAGAKQLYKMMDRIRKARTGTKKQGKQINPEKYLA